MGPVGAEGVHAPVATVTGGCNRGEVGIGTDGAVLLVALGVACTLFVVALGVSWDQESL